MNEGLYWLTLTALMTGLFWVPYILNRFKEMGIISALMSPNADPTPEAAWASRMMKAHENAVQNLVVFAPLVLAVHISGTGTAQTAMAAMVYFFARLAHYIIYTLGVPLLRTVTFLVGFACQVSLALNLLGVL